MRVLGVRHERQNSYLGGLGYPCGPACKRPEPRGPIKAFNQLRDRWELRVGDKANVSEYVVGQHFGNDFDCAGDVLTLLERETKGNGCHKRDNERSGPVERLSAIGHAALNVLVTTVLAALCSVGFIATVLLVYAMGRN